MMPSKQEQEWIDRLNEDAVPPPGMDWEAMRGGILDKMEPEERPKRRAVIWWWLPLVFLLGVGVSWWVISPSLRSASSERELPMSAHSEANAVRPEVVRLVEVVQPEPVRLVEVTPAFSQVGPPPPSLRSASSGPTWKKLNSVDTFNNPETELPLSAHLEANAGQPEPVRLMEVVHRLPTLARSAVSTVQPEPVRPAGVVVATPEAKITPPPPTSLTLLAGTLLERPRLLDGNPEGAALRRNSEREVGGYTAALQLRRRLSDRWAAVVGLGYERVDTRLHYKQVVRQFDTLLVNVPVFVNPATGQQRRGDVLTTAGETREIVHFNQRRRLTVTVLGEYRLPLGGLSLSAQAGPVLGYALNASGRQVNGPNDVGPLANYDRRISLSGYVGGQLSVPLGGWELRAQLGLRQSVLHERAGGVKNVRMSTMGSVGVCRGL